MRKDVKFGLTVGGILAATLIVYAVLLLHSGNAAKNGSQDNQVATDTTPPPEQPLAAPELAAPIVPQLTPPAPTPAPDNRVTITQTPDTTGNTAAPAVTPATQPSTGGDWNTALNSTAPLPTPTQPALIDPQPLPLPTVVTPETRQPIMVDVPATQPADNVSTNLPPLSSPVVDAAAAPATGTAQRTHTVVAGDSPWTIAQAAYGNGSFYTKIIAANPGINPNRVKIGTVLVIPDLTDTDRHPMVAVNGADPSPAQPLDVASEYRVVSGDTLERISNKLYGSSKMVEKLYQANKDLIGADQNKLKLGWVLKLPQPPSTTAAVPNTPVAAPAMPAASTTPPDTDIPAN